MTCLFLSCEELELEFAMNRTVVSVEENLRNIVCTVNLLINI